MLGKLLMACGAYVVLGAALGWCILFLMRFEIDGVWSLCLALGPLCLAVGIYLVVFVKFGCSEDH